MTVAPDEPAFTAVTNVDRAWLPTRPDGRSARGPSGPDAGAGASRSTHRRSGSRLRPEATTSHHLDALRRSAFAPTDASGSRGRHADSSQPSSQRSQGRWPRGAAPPANAAVAVQAARPLARPATSGSPASSGGPTCVERCCFEAREAAPPSRSSSMRPSTAHGVGITPLCDTCFETTRARTPAHPAAARGSARARRRRARAGSRATRPVRSRRWPACRGSRCDRRPSSPAAGASGGR